MNTDNIETQEALKSEVENIIAGSEKNRDQKLQDICQLLSDRVEEFDWVGFYLVDPDADKELVLGPFVGEETEHTRISFGEGICGQAAATNETFVVQDVDEADNYLSCSIHVKAEIVVPIQKDGTFVAELDIDSHTKNSLTDDHQEMLEEICGQLADLFDEIL